MSTRHSHVERIKINPADVLSLFLNNFLELVYSIPKMICSGFVYDNIAVQDWIAIKELFLFYFIYLFFFACLLFCATGLSCTSRSLACTWLVSWHIFDLLKEKCCHNWLGESLMGMLLRAEFYILSASLQSQVLIAVSLILTHWIFYPPFLSPTPPQVKG